MGFNLDFDAVCTAANGAGEAWHRRTIRAVIDEFVHQIRTDPRGAGLPDELGPSIESLLSDRAAQRVRRERDEAVAALSGNGSIPSSALVRAAFDRAVVEVLSKDPDDKAALAQSAGVRAVEDLFRGVFAQKTRECEQLRRDADAYQVAAQTAAVDLAQARKERDEALARGARLKETSKNMARALDAMGDIDTGGPADESVEARIRRDGAEIGRAHGRLDDAGIDRHRRSMRGTLSPWSLSDRIALLIEVRDDAIARAERAERELSAARADGMRVAEEAREFNRAAAEQRRADNAEIMALREGVNVALASAERAEQRVRFLETSIRMATATLGYPGTTLEDAAEKAADAVLAQQTRAERAEQELESSRVQPDEDMVERMAKIAWEGYDDGVPWEGAKAHEAEQQRAGIRAVLAALAAMGDEACRAALGNDSPWPTAACVKRLVEAADHLLNDHDCDTHGWEGIQIARDSVRDRIDALASLAPVLAAKDARIAEFEAQLQRHPSREAVAAAVVDAKNHARTKVDARRTDAPGDVAAAILDAFDPFAIADDAMARAKVERSSSTDADADVPEELLVAAAQHANALVNAGPLQVDADLVRDVLASDDVRTPWEFAAVGFVRGALWRRDEAKKFIDGMQDLLDSQEGMLAKENERLREQLASIRRELAPKPNETVVQSAQRARMGAQWYEAACHYLDGWDAPTCTSDGTPLRLDQRVNAVAIYVEKRAMARMIPDAVVRTWLDAGLAECESLRRRWRERQATAAALQHLFRDTTAMTPEYRDELVRVFGRNIPDDDRAELRALLDRAETWRAQSMSAADGAREAIRRIVADEKQRRGEDDELDREIGADVAKHILTHLDGATVASCFACALKSDEDEPAPLSASPGTSRFLVVWEDADGRAHVYGYPEQCVEAVAREVYEASTAPWTALVQVVKMRGGRSE